MHWHNRRLKFRQLLQGNACVYPGSVYDPLSARMAEDLGFEVGMFAGSIASLTVLGDPDHILLTSSEFADQAYRICKSCHMPIMVDADHGYGNALNVKRTVEELETMGVSGLSIEDTVLPRPFGSRGKTELISIEEGIGKMRAAVAGREDPLLVIAARTSAPRIKPMSEVLERIGAYQETGVDALFLIGVKTRKQLEEISDSAKLPIILGGASVEIMDLDYLSGMGVRLCLQGHQPFMAAVEATYQTLKSIRNGTPVSQLNGLVDKKRLSRFDRTENYDDWINRFLDSPVQE